ncbi:MAG: pyridoxal phosphate-dependent aminotransferase [Candidatus Methanospirareceae archaeon]
MEIDKKVRGEVLSLRKPEHGGDVWGYEGAEDFSSNVNPLGPPAEIEEYVLEAMDKLRFYPEDSSKQLKNAISNHFDIPSKNIIIGSGSVELIRLFPEVFLERGDKVIIPQPTFDEYAFACELMGACVERFSLSEEEDFKVNFNGLLERIGEDAKVKVVFLCNPNNPTSRIERKDKVMELVEECERKGILVFIDEALIDFVDSDKDYSCLQEVESHHNLFIIRSFTKAFAIPGLRVGYGVGSEEIIKYMDRVRLSWNVSSIAQFVASRLLNECKGHVEKAKGIIKSEKKRIYDRLVEMGFHTYYPDAHFFFLRIDNLGINGGEFKKRMLRQGILVRDCSSFGGVCHRYTRFCIKTSKDNEKLLRAIEAVIEGSGKKSIKER